MFLKNARNAGFTAQQRKNANEITVDTKLSTIKYLHCQWLMQNIAELEDTLTHSKTVTLWEHFPKLVENLQYTSCTTVTRPK